MRRTNAILWTLQILLALGFLFAGGMKLVTPATTLAPLVKPLPLGLIRFIGLCEATGALGLILPGLLHIRPRLTPMAAIGLTIIMSGAVSAMIALGRTNEAVLPAIFGILALVIASGRTFVAPLAKTRQLAPRARLVAAPSAAQLAHSLH